MKTIHQPCAKFKQYSIELESFEEVKEKRMQAAEEQQKRMLPAIKQTRFRVCLGWLEGEGRLKKKETNKNLQALNKCSQTFIHQGRIYGTHFCIYFFGSFRGSNLLFFSLFTFRLLNRQPIQAPAFVLFAGFFRPILYFTLHCNRWPR